MPVNVGSMLDGIHRDNYTICGCRDHEFMVSTDLNDISRRSSGKRWPQMSPWLCLLEGCCRLQNECVCMPPSNDLQRSRQPLAHQSTWHAGGRLPRHVKGEGEGESVENGCQVGSFNLGRPALDRPRPDRHLGRQEQIILLKKNRCTCI